MKKIIIFTVLIMSSIFCKQIYFETNDIPLLESTKSAMVIEDFNKENTRNPLFREDIILFDWNFESEESAWNADSGWEWTDASNLSSGVYMIKAESSNQVSTQKIMLLK